MRTRLHGGRERAVPSRRNSSIVFMSLPSRRRKDRLLAIPSICWKDQYCVGSSNAGLNTNTPATKRQIPLETIQFQRYQRQDKTNDEVTGKRQKILTENKNRTSSCSPASRRASKETHHHVTCWRKKQRPSSPSQACVIPSGLRLSNHTKQHFRTLHYRLFLDPYPTRSGAQTSPGAHRVVAG